MPNFKELLKEALARAIDNLNRFLLVLLLITFIISIFVDTLIADLIPLLILVIFAYRLISKDKYKRDKENKKYLSIKKTILKPFTVLIKNLKDHNSIYRRCHKCKTILKLPLPYDRGIQHAICPNCGKRITFITFRKVKIEVIKKKKD